MKKRKIMSVYVALIYLFFDLILKIEIENRCNEKENAFIRLKKKHEKNMRNCPT